MAPLLFFMQGVTHSDALHQVTGYGVLSTSTRV
jgi:hypothetical protein